MSGPARGFKLRSCCAEPTECKLSFLVEKLVFDLLLLHHVPWIDDTKSSDISTEEDRVLRVPDDDAGYEDPSQPCQMHTLAIHYDTPRYPRQ